MINNKCIIMAMSNQKGGVAKTASTAAIASVLASMGYSVLLIDLDGQGNLSHTFLSTIPQETVADMLNDGTLPIVHVRERLDIIPCDSSVSTVAQAMCEPDDRLILKKALKKTRGQYDFIIIDCPPAYNYITVNAYSAADFIFVPSDTSQDCNEGIALMADACLTAAPPKTISGIFFTMYDPRPKINREVEEAIRGKYSSLVMKTTIRVSCKVKEARRKRTDIVSFAPKSNPALDYVALVEEILDIINHEDNETD